MFNEAENIKTKLRNYSSFKTIKNTNNEFEIIYVDDASTDNTLRDFKRLNNNVSTKIITNNSNLAQSKSILNGIEVSSFNNIILLDGIFKMILKIL